MGGIIAGAGGAKNGVLDVAHNGSIDNVEATRIAGFANGSDLVAGNAVLSIVKLQANVIGADLNGNGVFDYTEGGTTNTTFELSDSPNADGDVAIDGLVLVKVGGFAAPPVAPLKIVTVT